MIVLKSANELSLMRKAGNIVYQTHQELKKYIAPSITTKELDTVAEKFIRSLGATSSFKGYSGFPGSICASVNDELVHGIPSNRPLKEGDILSVDIGACYKGYHGDSAWTYPVGNISDEAASLLDVTEQSLYKGLQSIEAPNARLYDISHAVQKHVEDSGYSIVREYAGHGIGQKLHEEPSIPNYGTKGKGIRLLPGMTLAIEPMVNIGERFVKTLPDKWTVVTSDGSLCAHFEHTVLVTESGYAILTGESRE